MADLTNINNIFVASKSQFTLPIYNHIWRTNPYVSLIPRAEYDTNAGLQPEVVTSTAELPTSYPDNLATLTALSSGTGSTCDLPSNVMLDGYIDRTFTLEMDSWQTRTICLTDLQFDWQAESQISNLQKNIQQFATVRWSDWYRVKNICMSQNKVSTLAADAIYTSLDGNCDFSALLATCRLAP